MGLGHEQRRGGEVWQGEQTARSAGMYLNPYMKRFVVVGHLEVTGEVRNDLGWCERGGETGRRGIGGGWVTHSAEHRVFPMQAGDRQGFIEFPRG